MRTYRIEKLIDLWKSIYRFISNNRNAATTNRTDYHHLLDSLYEQIFFMACFIHHNIKKDSFFKSLSRSSCFCWLGYCLKLLPTIMVMSAPCCFLITINIYYCNWITSPIFSLFTNVSGSKFSSIKICPWFQQIDFIIFFSDYDFYHANLMYPLALPTWLQLFD
jgi:hypothetical protein